MANQNSLLVVESLLDSGRLLRDGNLLAYAPKSTLSSPTAAIMLRPSPEIAGLLATYGITQTDKAFHVVLELLKQRCQYEGIPATLAAIGHIDTSSHQVCISDGNGRYYDNPADLESVQTNGTDRLWFVKTGELLKLESATLTMSLDTLFEAFNYKEGQFRPSEIKLLLKAYVMAVTFYRGSHDIFPVLLVSGPPQSGKSTLLRTLNVLFYGQSEQIPVLTETAKSFEAFLRFPFTSLDHNKASIPNWLPTLLQNVALGAPTGQSGRNRYNTVIFHEHLYTGIATRTFNSKFQTILPYALHIDLDLPVAGQLNTIVRQALHNRSAIMNFLFHEVQTVIRYNGPLPHIPDSAGYLTTFFELTARIGLALGQRDIVGSLLAKLGCSVPMTIEPDEPVYRTLKHWVSNNPEAEPMKSKDLVKQLYAIDGNDLPKGLTGAFLGQWIKTHDELLCEKLGLVKPIKVDRKAKQYQFRGVVSGKDQ